MANCEKWVSIRINGKNYSVCCEVEKKGHTVHKFWGKDIDGTSLGIEWV